MYLQPVTKSFSNHKYDTTDYKDLDVARLTWCLALGDPTLRFLKPLERSLMDLKRIHSDVFNAGSFARPI